MTTKQQTDPRIEALAKFLGIDADDVSPNRYDSDTFDADGGEYLVVTDDEADTIVTDRIKESLWAFNADFIALHTKGGLSDECIDAIREMQNRLCESANPLVEALIDDLDHFIDDAVKSDGRGHFISSYDGEENESGEYFIYRTN